MDGRSWRDAVAGPQIDPSVLNWDGGIRDYPSHYPRTRSDDKVQAAVLANPAPRDHTKVDLDWYLLTPMKVRLSADALFWPGVYRIVAGASGGGGEFPYAWRSNEVIVTVE
ncbi:MAG: hypothetical protein ACYTKD_04860 [Planctomycetota bacterium]